MTITPDQLTAWARITDAATAGPLTIEPDGPKANTVYRLVPLSAVADRLRQGISVRPAYIATCLNKTDATFIGTARIAMPLLIERVSRVTALESALRQCVETMRYSREAIREASMIADDRWDCERVRCEDTIAAARAALGDEP